MCVSVSGARYLEVSYKCHSKAADRESHQTADVQPSSVHSVFQLEVSEDGNNEPWNREEPMENEQNKQLA